MFQANDLSFIAIKLIVLGGFDYLQHNSDSNRRCFESKVCSNRVAYCHKGDKDFQVRSNFSERSINTL